LRGMSHLALPAPTRDLSAEYSRLGRVYVVVLAFVTHDLCDEPGSTKLIRVPARQFIHLFSDLKKPCDTLASRGVSLQQHSTMLPPGELVFIKRGHSSAVIIVGGGDEELRGLDVHLVVGIGMQCISSRVDSVGIVDFDQKLAHGREDLIPELHELQNQIRTIRGSLNNTCKKDFRSHSSNPPIHFKIAAGTKTSSGRTARSRMSVNVGMEAGIASAIEVKW
ncbi:hypothetical protein KCV04_g67, partial [Aureobasidium melanogenum]